MKKAIYSEKHRQFCGLIIEARKKAGLTQQELADKIGHHQSFVAKYEIGERRLDIIELLEIAKFIKLDFQKLIKKLS